MSQEGVAQGEHFLIVLYGITLFPMTEDIRSKDLGILSIFYTDYAEFNGSNWRHARMRRILLDKVRIGVLP